MLIIYPLINIMYTSMLGLYLIRHVLGEPPQMKSFRLPPSDYYFAVTLFVIRQKVPYVLLCQTRNATFFLDSGHVLYYCSHTQGEVVRYTPISGLGALLWPRDVNNRLGLFGLCQSFAPLTASITQLRHSYKQVHHPSTNSIVSKTRGRCAV